MDGWVMHVQMKSYSLDPLFELDATADVVVTEHE